ncbi:hypothetical protein P170DRAFT_398575 [Aspergillus steynii IBT 23096]|uniref:Uncharacterized protein n=1 Tax=Aspergillus steynii IBT 23096 TaxID=1392250 RepID=A0A2I2GPK7_9EURO|nr:uncharacterized protein P170DRAFT_398575 [Aspergillus steynii IBT 23096]PLB54806.1 hypothetical protein P170DRAFT_398575 [Aspergillus steynii IBT 23096]
MSLPRAPNPFRHPNKSRHYSRLACQISGSTIPRRPNRITTSTASPRPAGPEPRTRTPAPSTKRSFHTTHPLSAARAPKIRIAENTRSRARPAFSNDGLYQGGVVNDIPNRLKTLEELGPKLWRTSIIEGFVDEDVDRKTFMYVARGVLKSAASRAPSGAAVREISENPDLVFKIGHVVATNSPSLMQWVISSTAQAGAIIPTLMSASRALAKADSSPGTTVPQRTPIFEKVEHLALEAHDPRAMLIHAKLLGQQKRYPEALQLAESVMSMIYPSKTNPPPTRSMDIPNLEPPWAIYSWLKRCAKPETSEPTSEPELKPETDTDMDMDMDMLKTAALEYQDPEALVTYATHMMATNDLAKYEECMSKAATAGYAPACRKLANFYYLTSQGRFPRRGTKSTDPAGDFERAKAANERAAAPGASKLKAFLSGLFGPQPYHEYRGLAIEWYELAFRHGCPRAALALAILMRENGEAMETVEPVFQYVLMSSAQLGGLIRPFRVNWEREDYVPMVPGEVLDV